MLEKWKKAVVHLECATDSKSFEDRQKRSSELRADMEKGLITYEQLQELDSFKGRDVRFHGTALFISHEGRRYLLTARHVLWDSTEAQRRLESDSQRLLSMPEEVREFLQQSAKNSAQNNIFNIIFRVPSLDEVQAGQPQPEFLMNLGAGTSASAPYTFSEPNLDLALISLDQRNSDFADHLVSSGFIPISSDEISDGPEAEGQDLFAIGFPSATALLGQVTQHPADTNWSSSHYSLPISSFGRVSMLHPLLPFFWADISIYPGNSGGPVVANDRLVGIVSAQATLPIDDVPNVRTRIPFGRIVKTSYVRAMLEQQAQKDRN